MPKKIAYNVNELNQWIKKEKEMGTSDVDIRQILKQNTGWTDEEVEQWNIGVTALARLKGFTFDEARSALLKYSKVDREKILSSENVKKLEKEIRAGSDKAQPVSLDDLLTPLRNRK